MEQERDPYFVRLCGQQWLINSTIRHSARSMRESKQSRQPFGLQNHLDVLDERQGSCPRTAICSRFGRWAATLIRSSCEARGQSLRLAGAMIGRRRSRPGVTGQLTDHIDCCPREPKALLDQPARNRDDSRRYKRPLALVPARAAIGDSSNPPNALYHKDDEHVLLDDVLRSDTYTVSEEVIPLVEETVTVGKQQVVTGRAACRPSPTRSELARADVRQETVVLCRQEITPTEVLSKSAASELVCQQNDAHIGRRSVHGIVNATRGRLVRPSC